MNNFVLLIICNNSTPRLQESSAHFLSRCVNQSKEELLSRGLYGPISGSLLHSLIRSRIYNIGYQSLEKYFNSTSSHPSPPGVIGSCDRFLSCCILVIGYCYCCCCFVLNNFPFLVAVFSLSVQNWK